jgi:CheY-like chemotaxis protein
VDPAQIEQVILNLAINARDAMPKGGKLTIETANVRLGAAYADGRGDVTEGPHVMLAVSDTGTGIDAKDLPHVFEPFYTTKPVGEGTGLGLATVYGIVKQSGGHVFIYSEPSVGTTFKLYFPCAESHAEASERIGGTESSTGGTEIVLLVEDDSTVRELAARALREAGYRVLVAPSPAAALQLVEDCAGNVDILLTDVILPGMSGKALADQIVARFGRIRVLFVSGYTQNTIVHHGVLDAGVQFLPKPFTPAVLRDAVRRVLDGR